MCVSMTAITGAGIVCENSIDTTSNENSIINLLTISKFTKDCIIVCMSIRPQRHTIFFFLQCMTCPQITSSQWEKKKSIGWFVIFGLYCCKLHTWFTVPLLWFSFTMIYCTTNRLHLRENTSQNHHDWFHCIILINADNIVKHETVLWCNGIWSNLVIVHAIHSITPTFQMNLEQNINELITKSWWYTTIEVERKLKMK